tara:strand:+ start:5573 stop:5905 length:333 start_codon:yes stop_codon:yes gene_type:complete
MKTIKSIDGKSLLIGGLLVAIMFIGVAAQEAPKKAAQKYEYAWMLEPVYALSAGEELKKLNDDVLTPSIRSADYLNWAAKDGWEVCPSGINHKIDNRGWKYYTLMRRPIK